MDKKISSLLHKIGNLLTSSGLSIEMILKESSEKLNIEQKKYLESALLDYKKIKKLLSQLSKYLNRN